MKQWPHAPVHQLGPGGAYIITAGTYQKLHHFSSAKRLDLLSEAIFEAAQRFKWQLQAWAVFPNHYHFVALTQSSARLPELTRHIHAQTASAINDEDQMPKRKVWFQYWDTHLTFERSYNARLRYVHENAVHHGLVREATAYPWCSAGWFQLRAQASFFKRIMSLPIDKVRVRDDFDVTPFEW